MLNKVKIGAIVAIVLSAVKAFAPNVGIPEGLADALVLVVTFVAQFFVKETLATVAALTLKK